jgi:uncharacterized protein with von Willebrand factor type A (vWA) domain
MKSILQLTKEVRIANQEVIDIEIDSAEKFTIAETVRKKLSGLKKEIKEYFDKTLIPAKATVKEATATMKDFTGVVEVCELNLKEKQTAYIRAEEEKAEAERKRLQKIADDKAEMERLAEIEEAEKTKRDYEQAGASVEDIKQKEQKIDILYQAPLIVKAAKVEAAPVKADMRTFKKIYYAEVVNSSLIPREYLMPDMQMLNSIAKEQKEGMNIPGVVAKFR